MVRKNSGRKNSGRKNVDRTRKKQSLTQTPRNMGNVIILLAFELCEPLYLHNIEIIHEFPPMKTKSQAKYKGAEFSTLMMPK